jgi:3-dehydroquinate dehydratase-1
MNSGRYSLICVSVAEPTVELCLEALKGLDFAEVRIDAMNVTIEDMERIFSKPLMLIATFMPADPAVMPDKVVDTDTRLKYLIAAIEAGAKYVDIEIESDSAYRREIIKKAKQKDCKVIISFHDFYSTPEQKKLEEITELCFSEGADIAKIACRVTSERDSLRLLGLLNNYDYQGRTVVIGMGNKGRITRVAAPLLGCPFTFASISKGKETAEGQIEKDTMEQMMRLLTDE